MVRPPKQSPKRVAAFSAPQAALLVAASAGSRLGPLLDFAWRTGLRRGELLALRWADVDLAGARLRVEQSRCKVRGGTALQAPKTGAGRRGLSLPGSAVAALRRQADLQAADRAALGDGWRDFGLTEGPIVPADPVGAERPAGAGREDRAGSRSIPALGVGQEGVEGVRRRAVGLGQQVKIRVHGGADPAMAQPPADDLDRRAGGELQAGRGMAQAVERHGRQAGAIPEGIDGAHALSRNG